MEIFVFKTNISCKKDFKMISALMDQIRIVNWNVDFEDIDRVLRIVTETVQPKEVIQLMKSKGFHCEELPD